jgi:NADPH-dependent 2,4-dienoyl-CoA reductase/sulfur reductase-like enzyme
LGLEKPQMHHILIGAGPAGVVAAETLRKLDPGCQITLVGDEPEPPYSRMAIPYLLVENINERGTYPRKGDGHYESQRIELLRDRVSGVQPGERAIKLEKSGVLDYDKLPVATGSPRPRPRSRGSFHPTGMAARPWRTPA